MDSSKVLQTVVATLLGASAITAISLASAQSYCSGNYCYVTAQPPDESGSGGGTGGWSGQSSAPPQWCQDAGCNEQPLACQDLLQSAPPSCNISNPPPLTVNGCGSGITSYLVPDSLVVPQYVVDNSYGAPLDQTAYDWVSAPFGPLFTAACNAHDVCYGIYGSDKHTCDANLGEDMRQRAIDVIPYAEQTYYMPWVEMQSKMYSSGLKHPLVEALFSNEAYNSAQADAACRAHAELINIYCG